MQHRVALPCSQHADGSLPAEANGVPGFYTIEVLSGGRWRKFIYDPETGEVQGEFFVCVGNAKTLESAVLLIKIVLFEPVAETRITSRLKGLSLPSGLRTKRWEADPPAP
jgi:hypothetical protein